MFERFFPDVSYKSAYVIPYEKLYEDGIRGLIFDIDNTLVPHDAPADGRAERLFERLKEIGFSTCLISNNNEARVKMFNENIQTKYIYKANKPSPESYHRAMELMGTDLESTVFIGDQIFTDIMGAKKAGMKNILLKPINKKEKASIVLKRYLEKPVLYFYEKSVKKGQRGAGHPPKASKRG